MLCENGKAPVGAGTPARATGCGLPTTDSRRNCITDSRKTPSISELLQTGAENGRTLRQLVALTGLDECSVRLQIQRERKIGKLILSNCKNGYYLPEHPEDVQRFVRSMSHRAAEISAIARTAEAALAGFTGQTQIEGWCNG